MDEKKVREAIETFNTEIRTYKNMMYYARCVDNNHDYECYKGRIQVCETAIEALEKQLPNKPVESNTFGDNFIYYKCPKCKTIVQIQADYCILCGQQLNWTET